MPTSPDVLRLAEACATRLHTESGVDTAVMEPDFRRLLEAVRQSDPRFAFDRDGRPGAVAAVRAALPIIERDLLDAILEDHGCEVAAIREAMFQVARAAANPATGDV
jgi:hypothetical protein